MIHEHGDSMNISSNEDNPSWSIRHRRITSQKIVISLVLFTIAKIFELQIACVLLVGNRPRGNSRDQKRRRKCRLYKWIRSEKLFWSVGHILKTRPQHNTTQRYESTSIRLFLEILFLILNIFRTTKNKNAISDERENWNNGGQEEMNEMNDWYIFKFIFLLRTYRFLSDDVHNKLWVKECWLYPGPSIYSTAQNELLIIN